MGGGKHLRRLFCILFCYLEFFDVEVEFGYFAVLVYESFGGA